MFRVNIYVPLILNSQQEEVMQKKSLWKFGTREVVYSAIGAALYAILSIATNWLQIPSAANVSFRPAIAIPMFFGVAFGPIVGFIAGFLGNIINDLVAGGGGFWFWWHLGVGLIGFFPGLLAVSITNYKSLKSILMTELFIVIGVVVGIGIASISDIWVSGMSFSAIVLQDFIPAAIPYLVNGLILVPILMVAYSAIVQRSGR
jgi:energy-coupling factor transport system substrate-specific component